MSAHATLAPSAAERWFHCPGSIRLSEGIPSVSGPAAEEGSLLHDYAARVLRGENPYTFISTENHREMVQFYVDTIIDDFLYSGSTLPFQTYRRIEVKLDKLKQIHPNLWGTADLVGRDDGQKLLRVYDAKFGQKYVVAENNRQLMTYALGAALEYPGFKFNAVELTIVQPRGKTTATKVRRWRISAMELMVEFRGDLEKATRATDDPKAPLCAGDWCFFCPARKICPAQQEKKTEKALDAFAAVDDFDKLFGGKNEQSSH